MKLFLRCPLSFIYNIEQSDPAKILCNNGYGHIH